MGAFCSCLETQPEYSVIPGEDFADSTQAPSQPRLAPQAAPMTLETPAFETTTEPSTRSSPYSAADSVFHPIPDAKVHEDKLFDTSSPVFQGMVAEQKFQSKSSYDPKFIWINMKSRTLCLSQHNTRDRSHKEASFADITGIFAGPPERYKAPIGPDGKPIELQPALCLSIKFVRGGGIDLKFQTTTERDMWYDTLTRIIIQQKELERVSAAGHI